MACVLFFQSSAKRHLIDKNVLSISPSPTWITLLGSFFSMFATSDCKSHVTRELATCFSIFFKKKSYP
jgi:hypothetical protein